MRKIQLNQFTFGVYVSVAVFASRWFYVVVRQAARCLHADELSRGTTTVTASVD